MVVKQTNNKTTTTHTHRSSVGLSARPWREPRVFDVVDSFLLATSSRGEWCGIGRSVVCQRGNRHHQHMHIEHTVNRERRMRENSSRRIHVRGSPCDFDETLEKKLRMFKVTKNRQPSTTTTRTACLRASSTTFCSTRRPLPTSFVCRRGDIKKAV